MLRIRLGLILSLITLVLPPLCIPGICLAGAVSADWELRDVDAYGDEGEVVSPGASAEIAPSLLVVVDMQPYFATAMAASTLRNVAKEIRAAIERDDPIVFLEYEGCGPTAAPLRKLVKGYSRAFFAEKAQSDGSKKVMSCLSRHKLPQKHLRVCGVNTSACVLETVLGLLAATDTSYRIHVVGPACNSFVDHEVSLESMKQLPRVWVLR